MFRVIKPLNNNGLLALTEEGREVILLGKGIGFGKKSGERIESLGDGRQVGPVTAGT